VYETREGNKHDKAAHSACSRTTATAVSACVAAMAGASAVIAVTPQMDVPAAISEVILEGSPVKHMNDDYAN
jgi:hypothetical protein